MSILRPSVVAEVTFVLPTAFVAVPVLDTSSTVATSLTALAVLEIKPYLTKLLLSTAQTDIVLSGVEFRSMALAQTTAVLKGSMAADKVLDLDTYLNFSSFAESS